MTDNDPAPESHNLSQDDAPEQAQTLADEALGRTSSFADGETEKPADPNAEDDGGTPDLIDTMNQMVSSGQIDMGAYAGERNDDDEEGSYGSDADADAALDFPHGAE